MRKPAPFDPSEFAVALSHRFSATTTPERADPEVPVDGAVFGVATMRENSPHAGERHPDGDEVLYLISGRIRVVFTDDPLPDVEVTPGGGPVAPQGLWHRVDILEPCQIVYLTRGPNNEHRPLAAGD